MWEYQNIKTFLQKEYALNWSVEVFVAKNVINTVLWRYAISDLNEKEIIKTFNEKVLQKSNKKEFSIEKIVKRKWTICNKLYVKWEGYNNSLNILIDENDIVIKMNYFPEPQANKNITEIWLDLSNYAKKPDLKSQLALINQNFLRRII